MFGYIYALINASMPDQIKIGRTINDPEDRANDIYTGDTGVPTPFRLAYFVEVGDPVKAEKSIFETFRQERVNPRREFFAVSLKEAIPEMEKLKELFPLSDTENAATENVSDISGNDIDESSHIYEINFDFEEQVTLQKNNVSVRGILKLEEQSGLYVLSFTGKPGVADFIYPLGVDPYFSRTPQTFRSIRKKFVRYGDLDWITDEGFTLQGTMNYDDNTGNLSLQSNLVPTQNVFFKDIVYGQKCVDQLVEVYFHLALGTYSGFELESVESGIIDQSMDKWIWFLKHKAAIYDDSKMNHVVGIAKNEYEKWESKNKCIILTPEEFSEYTIDASGHVNKQHSIDEISHVNNVDLPEKKSSFRSFLDRLTPVSKTHYPSNKAPATIAYKLKHPSERLDFIANVNRLRLEN